MTNKQQKEIKCLNYFAISIQLYRGDDECNAEEEYFKITQDGKPKKYKNARLEQLLDAKKWRLRMCDMYEQGIIDGSVPFSTLLFDEDGKALPNYIINFLAKTMFKGTEKETIINCACA